MLVENLLSKPQEEFHNSFLIAGALTGLAYLAKTQIAASNIVAPRALVSTFEGTRVSSRYQGIHFEEIIIRRALDVKQSSLCPLFPHQHDWHDRAGFHGDFSLKTAD